jgi:uncharacterized protein (DUF1499 family)
MGVQADYSLARCRILPNCVSTRPGTSRGRALPGWTYNKPATDGSLARDAGGSSSAGKQHKTMEQAVADVVGVISGYPGATIVTKRETNSPDIGQGYYVYAEFESGIMGFVDDVEFLFMPDGSTVEFRSAPRLGVTDAGVNRKRMHEIEVLLQTLDNRWGVHAGQR